MEKHLFLIHGRNFKPKKSDLESFWLSAIESGITRDYSARRYSAYEKVNKTFIYYGDLSNKLLKNAGKKYSMKVDTADREKCLNELEEYEKKDFIGYTGKKKYRKLPGASSLKEFILDVFSEPLDKSNIAPAFIKGIYPDMKYYWEDGEFGRNVRARLAEPLYDVLNEGNQVLLVAHSLGSIIAYDVLWKFFRYWEYEELQDKFKNKQKPITLITLGSPLGNPTMRRHLKGSDKQGAFKYPTLIRDWYNFAAEDDYISHDQTLNDDYKEMLRLRLVKSIKDYRIYNLAIRNNKSNPHHGTGYLIHPMFIEVLQKWC